MYISLDSNSGLCNPQKSTYTFCKFFSIGFISLYHWTTEICLISIYDLHILLKLKLKILDTFININNSIEFAINTSMLLKSFVSGKFSDLEALQLLYISVRL